MNKTNYTYEDLLTAYNAWAKARPESRVHEWLIYLDLRDGVKRGTNEERYNKRFQRNGKPFRENKLDRAVFE